MCKTKCNDKAESETKSLFYFFGRVISHTIVIRKGKMENSGWLGREITCVCRKYSTQSFPVCIKCRQKCLAGKSNVTESDAS